MEALGLSKTELAERADISLSFVSDLTNGKANPSINTMEALASALDVPVPAMLEEGIFIAPAGYERVSAVLPAYRAFQVRKWAEEAREKLRVKPPQ
jgi:transcriptional regulator with XRE-family HTH domain